MNANSDSQPPPPVLEEWEVLDLLTRLVDKSLVVFEEDAHGQGRYRLLETVRQYSRDGLLKASDGTRWRDRHRDFFLQLAEDIHPRLYGPEQVGWYDYLEGEHDNLRAVLDWCLETPDGAEPGLRMVAALWHCWERRSRYHEGLERFTAALAREGADGRTAARAKALQEGCMAAWWVGDYATSQEWGEESLAIYRELGDKQGIATMQSDLARYAGSLAEARALREESVALLREIGNRGELAYALCLLGMTIRWQGDFAAARAPLEESLALHRERGNRQGLAQTIFALGMLALDRGDLAKACAWEEECLRIDVETGDINGYAYPMMALAGIAVAQGRMERAARLFGAAQKILDDLHLALNPSYRADWDRPEAAARAALGEKAFAAVWEEGRALSLEQAVAYALSGNGDASYP